MASLYLEVDDTFDPNQASSPKKYRLKKRKKKVFKLVHRFNDFGELDTYVRSNTLNGYRCAHNNGLVKCTLCCNNLYYFSIKFIVLYLEARGLIKVKTRGSGGRTLI